MSEENHIYYATNVFVIGDLDFCTKSKRTFDMSLESLATNKGLLDELFLADFNYSENTVKDFTNYLSSFSDNDKHEKHLHKLRTNPMLRILIMDAEVLQQVKQMDL